jgi:hypothetical protein
VRWRSRMRCRRARACKPPPAAPLAAPWRARDCAHARRGEAAREARLPKRQRRRAATVKIAAAFAAPHARSARLSAAHVLCFMMFMLVLFSTLAARVPRLAAAAAHALRAVVPMVASATAARAPFSAARMPPRGALLAARRLSGQLAGAPSTAAHAAALAPPLACCAGLLQQRRGLNVWEARACRAHVLLRGARARSCAAWHAAVRASRFCADAADASVAAPPAALFQGEARGAPRRPVRALHPTLHATQAQFCI